MDLNLLTEELDLDQDQDTLGRKRERENLLAEYFQSDPDLANELDLHQDLFPTPLCERVAPSP